MSNENQTFAIDQHELQHHSDLQHQRSAELSQAAVAPVEHLNNLHKELGVAGAAGTQALVDYHVTYRQAKLNDHAATRGKIGQSLSDLIPTFHGTDQETGRVINAAGDIRPVSQ
ncbi:hypothetical protein [Nocardia sp. NBC_01327]|uniref:hypothetical protein n=1 Tax=Nocardia sp. NBC_01327 TaxID=2903593 RepID=UPI002E1476B4|nr:hypothetical protein OG326_42745 [Nocardia sp. NBC_01327]